MTEVELIRAYGLDPETLTGLHDRAPERIPIRERVAVHSHRGRTVDRSVADRTARVLAEVRVVA